MWQVKKFKTLEDKENWVKKNQHRYQIDTIFINNGYAVDYRRLKIIDIK